MPNRVDVMIAIEMLGLKVDHFVICFHGPGHFQSNRRFIKTVIIKADGESLDRALHRTARQPKDGAAVDTTREVASHWNVSLEPKHDRLH